MSSIMMFHICAGGLGILSGATAMAMGKGSRNHAVTGNVFVLSMLSMTASGAYIAAFRWFQSQHSYQIANFLVALFTGYLVVTAWLTARRVHRKPDIFDWGSLVASSSLAIAFLICGWETSRGTEWLKHGLSASFFLVFGSIAVLAVWGDVRVLRQGKLLGIPRLRRHLWRMCTAMLIAVLSFFLGQASHLPLSVTRTHLNALPVLAALVYLIVWLFRVRSRKPNSQMLRQSEAKVYSLPT